MTLKTSLSFNGHFCPPCKVKLPASKDWSIRVWRRGISESEWINKINSLNLFDSNHLWVAILDHLDRKEFFYFSFFLYWTMTCLRGWNCTPKHNRNWLYAQGKHPPTHCYNTLKVNIKTKSSVRAVISHILESGFLPCRSFSGSGRSLALVWTCLSELLP